LTVIQPALLLAGSDRLASLKVSEALLQYLQLCAGPPQHRALHVELLACDEVEPRQLLLQHALEVLLQVAPQRGDVLGHGAGEAAREVVDQAGVESHG
jgi:hypothetical protein